MRAIQLHSPHSICSQRPKVNETQWKSSYSSLWYVFARIPTWYSSLKRKTLVILTISHFFAITLTLFRLFHRRRRYYLWWDDWIAFSALIPDIALVIVLWMSKADLGPSSLRWPPVAAKRTSSRLSNANSACTTRKVSNWYIYVHLGRMVSPNICEHQQDS